MLKIGRGASAPPFLVMDVIAAANARQAALAPSDPRVIRMEVGQPGTGAPAGAIAAAAAALRGADPLGYTEALGRLVMAVPGAVTSGPSAGCHQLIRDGALLVTGADDVLEAVGRLGVDLAPQREAPVRRTDGLGSVAALVHDALPARGARDTRWLARESGVPPDAIRAALTELERRGLARSRDGLWELAGPGRGG